MQQVWKMPKWMEQYRELIKTRDNRPIEEIMSDTSGDMNSPHTEMRERSMSNYAVAAQINLLNDLYQRGLLRKDE